MRTILFFILTSIFAFADQSPNDFMKSWVTEYNKNDSKSITSYYNQSEDTECLVSVGLWLKGYEEIKKMYHEDMNACRFYDSETEGMKQQLLGDIAVVSFIHRFKYSILDTGVHYQIHIRTTATLKKDKSSWKIVSEHSSPIKGITRAKIIKAENKAQ